ncbi:hypothetical protein OSTOST_07502 [Ostertagia ostertagi]
MHSFSYSIQEMPSSIMPASTTSDEFDGVLQDVEICMETLMRNSERRTALFSTIQSDARKVSCRLQNLPNRIKTPIDSMRAAVDNRKIQMKEKEREISALENHKNELQQENVFRISAKIEKLRERECLMDGVMSEYEKNMNLIREGSVILQKIGKRTNVAHTSRVADLSES